MTTIFVIVAFISGLLVGGILAWRWGGYVVRRSASLDVLEAGETASEHAAISALRHDRIIEAATALGRITEAEVVDLFCCSRVAAREYVEALLVAKRLQQQGTGSETVYVPVSTEGR
jgi:predicted HTH transcriptional regulator